MEPISAAQLASTATAFATTLAGLVCLLLVWLMRPQPTRWVWVYVGMLVTGLATIWFHGFGELRLPGLADSFTNLLLAWLTVMAAIGDYYPGRSPARWAGFGLGLLCLGVSAWRLFNQDLYYSIYAIPLGEFGGFRISEVLLIVSALLATSLHYVNLGKIPSDSRGLLYAMTGLYVIGMLLATAANDQVDFRIMAWHAIWHVVGAFGFVMLWAFNHKRFEPR